MQLLQHLFCYANLNFPLTYNGKEKRHLLLSDCRYFDKTFSKCFLGSTLPNIQLFPSLAVSFVVMATLRLKFEN